MVARSVPVGIAENVAGEDTDIVIEGPETMHSRILNPEVDLDADLDADRGGSGGETPNEPSPMVRTAKQYVMPPPFDFALASVAPVPCDPLYSRRADEKLWYAATSPPFNHGAPIFSINGDYDEPEDAKIPAPLRDRVKSAPYAQPHTLVFTLMLRDLETVTANPGLLDLCTTERTVFDAEWTPEDFDERPFWRPCVPDSSCWDAGDALPVLSPLDRDAATQTLTGTVGQMESDPGVLSFDSRFECGNLRRALRTGPASYDLVLNADINTTRHVQWFCFAVTGAEAGVSYRFCIVNLEKTNSQFNSGMRPLCFSVRDRGWSRVGDDIAYYPNQHPRPEETQAHGADGGAGVSAGGKGKGAKNNNGDFATYFTLSFTINFPNGPGDVYCIAFHYPYTYSALQRYLGGLESNDLGDRVHRGVLCETLSGNRADLLTITDMNAAVAPVAAESRDQSAPDSVSKAEPMRVAASGTELVTVGAESDGDGDGDGDDDGDGDGDAEVTAADEADGEDTHTPTPALALSQRAVVVLTARVHPGETNSSWIMKGIIDFLVGNTQTARELRSRLVFKIVPMLNPDGVINGNHRTNLSGHDLNREWLDPSPGLSPTIYHSRALLHYLNSPSYPHNLLLFCDFHGHSLRKHAFVYGCGEDDDESTFMFERVFPHLLARRAGNLFSWNLSSFKVQESKSKSARVSLYRDLGLINCYTLESTYMGTEAELVDRRGLERLGQSFCEALLLFTDSTVWRTVLGQLRGSESSMYAQAGVPRVFDESSSESESSDSDGDGDGTSASASRSRRRRDKEKGRGAGSSNSSSSGGPGGGGGRKKGGPPGKGKGKAKPPITRKK